MKPISSDNTYNNVKYSHCANNAERARHSDIENTSLVDCIDSVTHTATGKESAKNAIKGQNASGWLRCCLVSMGVATGIIALTGAGYGIYRCGRASVNDKALQPIQLGGVFPLLAPAPVTMFNTVSEIGYPTTAATFGSSPYAYYERRYTQQQAQPDRHTARVINGRMESTPPFSLMQTSKETIRSTVTSMPEVTTTSAVTTTDESALPIVRSTISSLPVSSSVMQSVSDTRLFSTEPPFILEIFNRHANQRDVFYNSIPKDIYFPLGRKMHKALAEYCMGDVHNTVFYASKSAPEKRCVFLREITDLIDLCKDEINTSIIINENKSSLLPEEHAKEIMLERKLTTLYIAAECIIEGRDVGEFYNASMTDNNPHTIEELHSRDNKIMKTVEELDEQMAC